MKVEEYLTALSLLREQMGQGAADWKYRSTEGLVLAEGTPFLAAPYPRGWKRGPAKECFRNAFDLALRIRSKRLRYCEGYAYQATCGLVTLHGWCVDDEDRVYDATWQSPERCEYRGFAMETEDLAHRLSRAAGTLPVLDCWQAGFPYLRDGWQSAA